MTKQVSLVIPTLNAGPGFGQLLQVIAAQHVDMPVEVLIVDSGSTDGTTELAWNAGVKVLSAPRRKFSHGGTRNLAIEATHGDYIVLTVQDAMPVGENWLTTLLHPMLEDETIAASYGLQVAPQDAGPLAQVRSTTWQRAHSEPQVKEVASPEAFWELSPQERLRLATFDDVTACIRREVWRLIPLPEVPFGEDLAWAVQSLLNGYRIAYVPEARVEHAHERSMTYELRRSFLYGRLRVRALGWLAPSMDFRTAIALLYEVYHPQLIRKCIQFGESADILNCLASELYGCDAESDLPFIQAYRHAAELGWVLVKTASELFPGSHLPEGVWPASARLATVLLVGETLGGATETHHGLVWWILRRYMARGV